MPDTDCATHRSLRITTSADVSALDGLGLTDGDRAALARQGFVSAERRGRSCQFRLRFRRHGRQVVRYLGTDPQRAAAVQQALEVLQRPRREVLELQRLARQARQELRASTVVLSPVLATLGLHFHGRSIRHRRPVSR